MTASTFYATPDEARAAHMMGSNLRCNRCGSYGADWIPNERPGWGCLALCPDDERELAVEHRRHAKALQELRAVNFEQPLPSMVRRREYDY